MASYFDPKPPGLKADPAAPIADEETFGRLSLLSPQVTRILDDIDFEEKSSSGDEDASQSGDSDTLDKDASSDSKASPSIEPLRKGETSAKSQSKKQVQISAPPPRPGGKAKHPHLARFQSLRSMLFSSHIEDNMTRQEQQEKEAAEAKWMADYESRKSRGRPKTPETPPKDGLTQRMGNKLKRLTSKDVPTMGKIQEGGDNDSTASSDEDEDLGIARPRPSNDDDISHSDIEDLVRWVSRRDPPSDGEVRSKQARDAPKEPQDSGHESLGHSDVEDLVRWVSRRDNAPPDENVGKEESVVLDHRYSDASTESDDEVAGARRESIREDDVDDLVRWVSHRDGPKAGPVREKGTRQAIDMASSSGEDDEDVEELSRWVTRKDDTSGESDGPDTSDTKAPIADNNLLSVPNQPKDGSKLRDQLSRPTSSAEDKKAMSHDDVDELVRWVSNRNPQIAGPSTADV